MRFATNRARVAGAVLIGLIAVAALGQQKPPRLPGGYLEARPDSLVLLPPAPASHSAAEARDRAAAKAAVAAHGTPRWEIATNDADLFSANAAKAFSCAAGREISPVATPAVDHLLRRTLADFGLATYGAKLRYQRARPFMVNHRPICTPDAEAMLRKDGSYPSGHSAIGFGWGLILGQLLPERADQTVARGRAFGESRRYCNVHWLSDVEEGRIIGAAVFARLQAAPAFQTDLTAARAELASVPRVEPSGDCAREAKVLAEF